jgi:hypothetical protein
VWGKESGSVDPHTPYPTSMQLTGKAHAGSMCSECAQSISDGALKHVPPNCLTATTPPRATLHQHNRGWARLVGAPRRGAAVVAAAASALKGAPSPIPRGDAAAPTLGYYQYLSVGGRPPAMDTGRLSVPSEGHTEGCGRPKRARRTAEDSPAPPAPKELHEPSTERPTTAERYAAELVIKEMRKAEVTPKILAPNAGADVAVVACALAMYFKQDLGCDRQAKMQFGVALSTDVRARWVSGKLARLVEAAPDALAGAEAIFSTTHQPADAAPDPTPPPTAAPDAAPATAAVPAVAAAPAANAADHKKRTTDIDYGKDTDVWVEVMREAADEFKRLKHLTLWSKQQRERWFTLPNPNVSTGDLCPQPSMTVINRNYVAAQHLPHAVGVIDALVRQRDDALRSLARMTDGFEAASSLLDIERANGCVAVACARMEWLLEEERCEQEATDRLIAEAEQLLPSPAQLERAERMKLAMIGLPSREGPPEDV